MPTSFKRRNSPLSYLRQTITTLPECGDLVLYLAALMFIMRNSRLANLSNSKTAAQFAINQIPVSELKQLVHVLINQLSSFSEGTSGQLQLDTTNDKHWTTIWQNLCNKQLDNLWLDETILGYIYQFQCLPERSLSLSSLSKSDKSIDTQTLISFTQLYTPNWIADFLLENTILPQWHEKVPAEKLTVLDPACGAGHILVSAFNLLTKLYIANGATEREAVQCILRQNLFGTDIDKKALSVAALALFVRSLKANTIDSLQLKNLAPAISHKLPDNLLGSLNRQWPDDHPLAKAYRVVVTNPPYIGRKLLDRSLKQALKTNYPNSHNDLANAFLERSIELVEPSGMVGLITQASIISLPSYTELRKSLLEKTCLDTCVELGPGVFPLQGGEKINSLMLVVKNQIPTDKQTCKFIDLTKSKDKACDLDETKNVYNVKQSVFSENTNQVFSYRSPAIVATFLKEAIPLAHLAEIRQGLATTNNDRFLRFWWDVDKDLIGQRWFPYAKGAGVRRWHNPIKHLVNWQNEGQEIKDAVNKAYPYLNGKSAWVVKNEKYYFRQGLTFSFIGGQDLAVRYLPSGCIFDVAGSAIFLSEEEIFYYLAYLNSSFIGAIARTLNPSINFQVGDLKKLPVVEFSSAEKIQLSHLAQRCFAIKEWLNGFDPTVFASTPEELTNIFNGQSIESSFNSYSSKHQQLATELNNKEEEINKIVLNAVGRQWQLQGSDLTALTNWSTCNPHGEENSLDARSYAKTCLYLLLKAQLDKKSALVFSLSNATELPVSEENANWLSRQLNQSISNYLAGEFNAHHGKQFLGSPQLLCRQVSGNGHAILFSTQTLRNIQKSKLPKESTADISMLQSLAAKLSDIPDWTGKHLLAYF